MTSAGRVRRLPYPPPAPQGGDHDRESGQQDDRPDDRPQRGSSHEAAADIAQALQRPDEPGEGDQPAYHDQYQPFHPADPPRRAPSLQPSLRDPGVSGFIPDMTAQA